MARADLGHPASAIGIGRAAWSQGPEGELYGGTISRTLEADPRSDSRISYNVVMLVTHGDTPYGAIGTFYLHAPYNFYAHGPTPGLAAMPVVLGGGAAPPRAYPEQVWGRSTRRVSRRIGSS